MAVQMVLKYEPLLNADIERDRLKLALSCCMITPNVLKVGFGDVDPARLQRGIDIVKQGYELPRELKAVELFDSSYLPAQKDRMVK